MVFGKPEQVYNRPENIRGSPTGILKYGEDLTRGPNTKIGRKGFFEIASSPRPQVNTLARRIELQQQMPFTEPIYGNSES